MEERPQHDRDFDTVRPKRLRRLGHVWSDGSFARYFLTICTANRAKVLANDEFHERLRGFLLSSPSRYGWHPMRYVVMPDHIHLLAVSAGQSSLGEWMKALEAVAGRRGIRWQTGFFDHVLRSGESESEKWLYVQQNPVRAGLVERAEDWQFGGEIRYDAE